MFTLSTNKKITTSTVQPLLKVRVFQLFIKVLVISIFQWYCISSAYNVHRYTTTESKLSLTELFYTTPGIQNALQLLSTHNESIDLPNTAAGFDYDEYDLK